MIGFDRIRRFAVILPKLNPVVVRAPLPFLDKAVLSRTPPFLRIVLFEAMLSGAQVTRSLPISPALELDRTCLSMSLAIPLRLAEGRTS
jgi:hypothetical protein